MGNDPHNQEIALCLLEDFGKNRNPLKDRLLLAAAHHTAKHRKYGDALDAPPGDLFVQVSPATTPPTFRRVPLPEDGIPFDESRDAGGRELMVTLRGQGYLLRHG